MAIIIIKIMVIIITTIQQLRFKPEQTFWSRQERFVKYVCCTMTLKYLFWYVLTWTKHSAGENYPFSFCSYEYGDRFKVCQNLTEN